MADEEQLHTTPGARVEAAIRPRESLLALGGIRLKLNHQASPEAFFSSSESQESVTQPALHRQVVGLADGGSYCGKVAHLSPIPSESTWPHWSTEGHVSTPP